MTEHPSAELAARLRALADQWEREDDTTQWGSHDKSVCARALRAALDRITPEGDAR